MRWKSARHANFAKCSSAKQAPKTVDHRIRLAESGRHGSFPAHGMACTAVESSPRTWKVVPGCWSVRLLAQEGLRRACEHCRSLLGEAEIDTAAVGAVVLQSSLRAGMRSSLQALVNPEEPRVWELSLTAMLEAHAKDVNASGASDMPLHPGCLRKQLLDADEARPGRADYRCILNKHTLCTVSARW